jgi:beta-lactamase regulating signal transducer with metallopeptidase domain
VSIGASLFLIAAGAILKYAVTESISAIDIQTVGTILLVIGILGLVISVAYMMVFSRRDEYPRDPRDVRDRDRY